MRWERAAAGRMFGRLLLAAALAAMGSTPAAADPDEAALREQADRLLNAVRLRVVDCTAGPRLVTALASPDSNGDRDVVVAAERPALRWSEPLARAAARHVGSMARTRVFAHRGADGTTVRERVDATGYRWQAVAENLAAGQSELHQAVADWLASVSHCQALTDQRFTEFGIARTRAEHPHDAYGTYWALVLGRPR